MLELMPSNRFAIDYKGPPSGQRYEKWREGICRNFCRLEAEPSANDRIDCRIDFALVHSLALATPSGLSGRFARTRELLSDGCDDFVLISASQGPVHVTQGRRSIELAAGQMCLAEMNIDGAVGLYGTGRYTTTRIPRRALLQVAPDAEAKLSQPQHEDTALITMIDRYFALCNETASKLDAVGQQISAQHLIDLVGILFGARGDQKDLIVKRGYSPARVELMKTEVLKNLDRAELCIDDIARANGLSTRQAQRMFAQSGTTYTQFVLEQRLALAQRLLLDPRSKHRKVSDIAYSAGFNDLSYFNRTFRRRFGTSPAGSRPEHMN
jgi:AraC-like DNA-binding protein